MGRAFARGRVARKVLPLASAVVMTALLGPGTASAALTSPTNGTVYRDGSVPIAESVGARYVKADGVAEMSSLEKLTCQAKSGSNPNGRPAKTIIDVVRLSDNVNVFHAEKPNSSALPAFLNDQGGPFATSWAIPQNAAPGLYQVRSTAENRRRVSFSNPCQLESVLVDTKTIEYRPWQHVFKDVFNGGRVSMNTVPAEFQAVVGNQTGAIHSGADDMAFYELPDDSWFALPSDPTACASDPESCLPSTAVQCAPADAGCDPRLVVINRDETSQPLLGVFDLETKAFIASADVNGHKRVLVSLGTEQDAAYQALLLQLAAAASEQGIDLMSVLATKVRARTGETEIGLSLLNGLQIQPSSAPGGVQIVSNATAQAGIVLNVYAHLGAQAKCTAGSGDSSSTTAAPDRYAHTADVGYTVQRSDLLPDVPRIGPVGALVGGPIYHIKGDFTGATAPLVNTSSAVIGVDTAADEPNGYPVWVQPFVSTPGNVTAAKTMDFIGTATWSASETSLGGGLCLSVNFMLGTGVALFNNPLPVGFGDLPIWDPQAPEVRALVEAVNSAVQGAVDTVTADPTVNDLLEQVLGALPPIT